MKIVLDLSHREWCIVLDALEAHVDHQLTIPYRLEFDVVLKKLREAFAKEGV